MLINISKEYTSFILTIKIEWTNTMTNLSNTIFQIIRYSKIIKKYIKEKVFIKKLYLGPIHLTDLSSIWSTLILSAMLLIYLWVLELAPVMTESNSELVSRLQSSWNTPDDSSFVLIHPQASCFISQNYLLIIN